MALTSWRTNGIRCLRLSFNVQNPPKTSLMESFQGFDVSKFLEKYKRTDKTHASQRFSILMVIPVRRHTDFEFMESLAGFFFGGGVSILSYISELRDLSLQSVLPKYTRYTLDEDVWFNTALAWRRSEHDLHLKTDGKLKSSTCSGEEIHNSLAYLLRYASSSPKQESGKFLIFVEACEIKDITYGTESNVYSHVTFFESVRESNSKTLGKNEIRMSPSLASLSMEICSTSW